MKSKINKKTKLKQIGISAITSASIVGSLFCAGQMAEAHAEPAVGCKTDAGFWLFHGTRRTICDGAIRPDGSWLRNREFFTPEHYAPLQTSCWGTYYVSCTTTGGYWVARASNGVEDYIVFPDNVLPDEPGHLVGNQ